MKLLYIAGKKEFFAHFLLRVGAVVLLFLFLSGPAHALDQGAFEDGCLIPYAYFDGAGVDTAIGITLATIPTTDVDADIYISFMDENGNQIDADFLPVQGGVVDYSLTLSTFTKDALNMTGWVMITYDDNGVLEPAENRQIIAANVFLVNMSGSDAALIPVVPLDRTDYKNETINLLNLPADVLSKMSYGYKSLGVAGFRSRYFIHPTGDPRTLLILFSPVGTETHYGAQMTSTSGLLNVSIALNTPNTLLNIIDLTSLAPPGFTEGSVYVNNMTSKYVGVAFALVYWSQVGAEQTLLPHELRH